MIKDMIIKKYQQQGLDTEYGIDMPNKVYEPHSHEKTYPCCTFRDVDVRHQDQQARRAVAVL